MESTINVIKEHGKYINVIKEHGKYYQCNQRTWYYQVIKELSM